MLFIILWNVSSELKSLKYITLDLNKSLLLKKAAFYLSPSLIHILLYSHMRSSLLKYFASFNLLITSLIRGNSIFVKFKNSGLSFSLFSFSFSILFSNLFFNFIFLESRVRVRVTICHTIMVTGHEMREGHRRFWRSDIIQYIQHMLTSFLTHSYLG